MLKYLKIGVSTLALTAFVTAPVVTVVTIATADSAYANNGKGNGGGGNKGGNKGGESSASKGGKGSGSDKADRGARAGKTHKGPKSKSAKAGTSRNGKGFGRAVQDEFKSISRNLKTHGIGGLFKGQTKQRTVARTAKVSVKESVRPPSKSARFKDGQTRPKHQDDLRDLGMHPSQLGKMNGLLNSSINAKLAHIANGQFTTGTGPVSVAARLAVADYQLDITESAVETLKDVSDEDIAAAQEAVKDLTPQDIQDLEKQAADESLSEEERSAAQATLDAKAIADAQDVLDQYGGVDAAMDAVGIAEADVLSTYKGTLTEDIEKALLGYTQVIEGEEITYTGAVRNSLPDTDAVGAALTSYQEKEAIKTADGELAEEDTAKTAEGELAEGDAAMVEEEEEDTPDQG